MPATLNVVVLAAGEGKRLKGRLPKVLSPIWGRPAVAWPVEAACELGPERVIVVAGQHLERVREALGAALPEAPLEFALQQDPRGTAHAVLAARDQLVGLTGRLLILNGDGPLIHAELLDALLATHTQAGAAVSLLSVSLDDPTGYGRIVRAADGGVDAIVEQKDASDEQRAIREVNAGAYLVELPAALELLDRIGSDNASGEQYLTDLVGLARAAGHGVAALHWPCAEDALGFNDQAELARVRAVLRRRIVAAHMDAGVEVVEPETTYIDAQVTIAPGARILPCTMIEGRVDIAAGCEVGPFSHLRDGTVLERGAEIGNFVETKKTRVGPGSKAKHLTYLGDAQIGAKANIGCGTITANYDGRHKHTTTIGDGAFIGSGTVLVAPSTVEAGATTGAGAIVKRSSVVGRGETWVGVPARPLAPAPRAAAGADEQEHEGPSGPGGGDDGD